MRKRTIFGIGLCLLFPLSFFAQLPIIQIRKNQTSHLVFPADIVYSDIGDNENFIVAYTNNILRVKGLVTDEQTNLTVLTKDQHFYSFYVQYSPTPQLNYFIMPQMAIKILGQTEPVPYFNRNNKSPPIASPTSSVNARRVNLPIQKDEVDEDSLSRPLYEKALTLLKEPHLYDYIGAKQGDIRLKVTGIYHSLDNCFIVYEIKNKGAIPYDIAYIEFGIKERKRPKKSALHEQRLTPLFTVKSDINRVLPYQVNEYVAVFNKITVPSDRLFYMEVVENGRNITLDILFHKLPIKRLR